MRINCSGTNLYAQPENPAYVPILLKEHQRIHRSEGFAE